MNLPMQKQKCFTMQKHLRDVLGDERGDSATLMLQKFLKLDDNEDSQSSFRHNSQHDNWKLKELKEFCRKSEAGKNFLPEDFSLPETEDGTSAAKVLTSGGRLLVNHSGGLIENSNLCLHRLFGFPMIPGSALKGITRAYANEDCEDRKQFARIFGGEEKGKSDEKGNVAFLPAIPADKNWKMVVDVLTSHDGSDTKNPVPVFFPAVERGAKFRFQIRKVSSKTSDEDLNAALQFLLGALTTNGAGAKTSAGYGWFRE